MRILVIFAVLVLAGCGSCERRFAEGELVKHRLLDLKGIVTYVSDIKNIEGYCLITVRTEDGKLGNYAVDEFEPLK